MAAWNNNKDDDDDDIICLDDSHDVEQPNKANIFKNKLSKNIVIDDELEIIGEFKCVSKPKPDHWIEELPPTYPRRIVNRKSLANQLIITSNFLKIKEPVKFNKNQEKDIYIISEDEENSKQQTNTKIKPKIKTKYKKTSLGHTTVNHSQTGLANTIKPNAKTTSSSQPMATMNNGDFFVVNKSSIDSNVSIAHSTSDHVNTELKSSYNSKDDTNKRHSIATHSHIHKEKITINNPFNEITQSVANCISSLQVSHANKKSQMKPSVENDNLLCVSPNTSLNKSPSLNINTCSLFNSLKQNQKIPILFKEKSLQVDQSIPTNNNKQTTENNISQIVVNNISKPNYLIFRKEVKTKLFPSTMKSVSDLLYDFCVLQNIDKIETNEFVTLNLNCKNLDMMEAHYMNDQLFYLKESLQIMEITLYKQTSAKFCLFDLYVQFEKTFNYFIKNGQKNNSIEDFNYHFNNFSKYLQSTNIDLDINTKNSHRELEDKNLEEEESPLDKAYTHWKNIISLNEKVLKYLVKEVNNPDASELNYSFFDITKQLLDIFIRKIYQPKFFKNKDYLNNHFNIGEEFFNSFLDIFENFVIENLKQNVSEKFVNMRFIYACHQMQTLIYYTLIFNKRFDKSKTKLFQMISSFQNVYIKLSNINKRLPLTFISLVLIHNEIKIKLCEKLLIDCRFARLLNVEKESQNFSKSPNPNDSNEIIFSYFQNLWNENTNEQKVEFLGLLNIYVECILKLIDSDTKSNNTLIATLFEIHDSTEDFIKSCLNLITNLRNLIQTPEEDVSYLKILINQLFFYSHVTNFA